MSDGESTIETQVEAIKSIYQRLLEAEDDKKALVFLELNDKLEFGNEFRMMKRIKQIIWLSAIPELLLEYLVLANFDDFRDGWKHAKALSFLLANISHASKEAKATLKTANPPLNEILLNLARRCPLPSVAAEIVDSLSHLCQGRSFLCQAIVKNYQGIATMLLKHTNSSMLVSLMQLLRTIANSGRGYVADMCRAYSVKLVDGYDLLLAIAAHLHHKKPEVVRETLKTLDLFSSEYPLNLLSLRKNKIDKTISSLRESTPELVQLCDKLLEMIKDAIQRGEELMRDQTRVLEPHEAATKIQSAFLGFMQRKLFKNQRKAALKVQRVWRKFVARKIEERKALLKQQVEEVHNEFQKHEVRLKEREKQLQVIQSLPARAVSAYVTSTRETAASRIQALWKGFKQRQKWKLVLDAIKKDRAAFKIQSSFRKYVNKKRTPKIKDLEEEIFKFDITQERYQQIKEEISKARQKWRASMYYENKKWPTRSELYELHDRAQIANQAIDALQPHLHASAQRIQMLQKELLAVTNKISGIKSINDLPPSLYLHSRDRVSKDALENHRKMIEKAREPWWKRNENTQELSLPPLDYYKQKAEENLRKVQSIKL